MNSEGKSVAESRTECTYLVRPCHLNVRDELFGGQLMSWVDTISGITAVKHTEQLCTTVSVNQNFYKPILQGSMLVLDSYLTYVGRTSMEVCVDTSILHRGGKKELVSQAWVTYVAIDASGRPIPVHTLVAVNEQEQLAWESGARRAAQNKENRTGLK